MVFGEVLVGSGVWTGNQLEIVAVGSVNLTEFGGPALNGYIPENNMNIKDHSKITKAAIAFTICEILISLKSFTSS